MPKIVKINALHTQELEAVKLALEDFTNLTALCIGDVMLDHYVQGQIKRISPEAPVPVLKSSDSYSTLGGAGNLVANMATLGAISYFTTIVGNDDGAKTIKKIAQSYDNLGLHLLKLSDRPTTTKTRYISQNQQILRIDNESDQQISPSDVDTILQHTHTQITKSDIVIISDYKKGLITDSLSTQVIMQAHAHGKKVIVDPKGSDYNKYKDCDFITPNLSELALATGFDLDSLQNDLKFGGKSSQKAHT